MGLSDKQVIPEVYHPCEVCRCNKDNTLKRYNNMFVFAIESAIKWEFLNNIKKLEGLINYVFKKTHFSEIRSV